LACSSSCNILDNSGHGVTSSETFYFRSEYTTMPGYWPWNMALGNIKRGTIFYVKLFPRDQQYITQFCIFLLQLARYPLFQCVDFAHSHVIFWGGMWDALSPYGAPRLSLILVMCLDC
jgi:hypothetical protein